MTSQQIKEKMSELFTQWGDIKDDSSISEKEKERRIDTLRIKIANLQTELEKIEKNEK